jgi:hypothetical protein
MLLWRDFRHHFALWDLSPGYQARVDPVLTSSVSHPSLTKPYTDWCWFESWLRLSSGSVHEVMPMTESRLVTVSASHLWPTENRMAHLHPQGSSKEEHSKTVKYYPQWKIHCISLLLKTLVTNDRLLGSAWLSVWTIYKHYNININMNTVEPLTLRSLYGLICLIYHVC